MESPVKILENFLSPENCKYLIDTYAQRIVNAEGTVPVMCVNPNRDVFKSEFVI